MDVSLKIYERKSELEELMFQYASLNGASYAVFIEGEPGVGSTALAEHFLRKISDRGPAVIRCMACGMMTAIPYIAFSRGISRFFKLVMKGAKGTEDRFSNIRTLQLINPIAEMVPEVKTLGGKFHFIPADVDTEMREPVENGFAHLISLLRKESVPLVIFIDDAHLLDRASIDLLLSLLDRDLLSNTLFLCTVEKGEASEIFSFFKEYTRKKIVLEPLSEDGVMELITDRIKGDEKETLVLHSFFREVTFSRPYDCTELYCQLWEKGYICDVGNGSSRWDMDAIRTDRDLFCNESGVVRECIYMERDKQELLELFSCAGDHIPGDLAAKLAGISRKSLGIQLRWAEQARFLRISADGVHFFHPLVRKRIYQDMDDERRWERHFTIASILNREEDVMMKAFHLNRSSHLLDSVEKKIQAAVTNIRAARFARRKNGIHEAVSFLREAAGYFKEMPESAAPELYLEMQIEKAECSMMGGDEGEAGTLIESVLDNLEGRERRMAFASRMTSLYEMRDNPEKAVELGKRILDESTTPIPDSLVKLKIFFNFIPLAFKMWGKRKEKLLFREPVKKESVKAEIELLNALFVPLLRQECMKEALWVTIQILRRIFRYGPAMDCAKTFFAFGTFAAMYLRKHSIVKHYAEFGIAVSEKLDSRIIYNRTELYLTLFILPGEMGVSDVEKKFLEIADNASFLGDWICESVALQRHLECSFIGGTHLPEIASRHRKYSDRIKRSSTTSVRKQLSLQERVLSVLIGTTQDAVEEACESELCGAGRIYSLMSGVKVNVIMGWHKKAFENITTLNGTAGIVEPTLQYGEFLYFGSIALCRMARGMGLRDRVMWLRKVKKWSVLLEKMAEALPDSFHHKRVLVQAELEALKGRTEKAVRLAAESAVEAEKYGFLQNSAVAWESAGSYYFSKGMKEAASGYYRKALFHYSSWGAWGKVRKLQLEIAAIVPPPARTVANYNLDSFFPIVKSVEKSDLFMNMLTVIMKTTGVDSAIVVDEREEIDALYGMTKNDGQISFFQGREAGYLLECVKWKSGRINPVCFLPGNPSNLYVRIGGEESSLTLLAVEYKSETLLHEDHRHTVTSAANLAGIMLNRFRNEKKRKRRAL